MKGGPSLGGAAHKARGPDLSWPSRVKVATVGWPPLRGEVVYGGRVSRSSS